MSKGTTGYRFTVGFDVSDKTAMVAVMDQAGRVCQEEQIELTLQAVRERFARLPRSRVALEAGGQTRWLARGLGDLGHEVLVANPRNIPLLTKSHRKSDRADAVLLARMARLDPELLSPVTLRSEAAQEDLLEVRARDHAVRQRTRSIGLGRGQAKQFGARLPGC